MDKILVCVPIIVNPVVVRECITQIINKPNVTVILANNGGGKPIADLLREYVDVPNVYLWHRDQNVYVNKIWNDFIDYFLIMEEWDHLIILNSDLTLNKNWNEVVQKRWELNPNEILVPRVTDDKTKMYESVDVSIQPVTRYYSGIPGIFISLNRNQAEKVSELPLECKVWYGDEWIFTILIALGEKVVSPENFLAFHHWSTSVSTVPGIHAIIEEDKIVWEQTAKSRMIEKIKTLKNVKE